MFKLLLVVCVLVICNAKLPVVVNTWAFTDATKNGWNMLKASGDPITALEEGCRTCQTLQCDFTVGYGGSPDENGETTLDAVIFDGATMNMGAVGGIRKVKDAIGVARKVLEHTQHSILVGDLASNFAAQMGFHLEPLETDYSKELHKNWTENNCQPNFWMNVYPDSTKSCGPYSPPIETVCVKESVLTNEIGENCDNKFNRVNHDTIGMVVISESGHVVAGTSTNGANHKIPGRVGDSPLPGAGAYADGEVGAAVATGNGDIMMRFLPSFLAVERMRFGDSPEEAAKIAIARIAKRFPTFFGGVIAVDKSGSIGAACNGMEKFPFSVMNSTAQDPVINYVKCTNV